jgi:GNAT superfamily N-acetyltransferase
MLREHQPGDMGWIISAHGRIYATEFGWDESFEIMVAEIAANFLKDYDANWERCWIAEVAGENVGSAMVVKQADGIAKLRLVIIDPKARGLGIGKRLVEEAIRFATRKNYHTMTLWTNSVLVAARGIYEDLGFTLMESEPYHGFGQDLVGENWQLDLKK